MNAVAERQETEDWSTPEMVTRANRLSSLLGDEIGQLWILARRGEPQTDMERLIRSQIDDAAAQATETFGELRRLLDWLVEHHPHRSSEAE